MACVTCGGRAGGCEACGHTAIFEFVGCPYKLLDASVRQALFASEQARLGNWPVSGGWMDQAQQLLDAVEFIGRDEARWKAQLGISNG